jgi:hypothetical protein
MSAPDNGKGNSLSNTGFFTELMWLTAWEDFMQHTYDLSLQNVLKKEWLKLQFFLTQFRKAAAIMIQLNVGHFI